MFGHDSVVKVADPDVPSDWPAFEAELTQALWQAGVPAPQVRDVIVVEGRPSVVFEHIPGPSMWQQMVAEPAEATALAVELASIQKRLQAVGIPPRIPELVDRLIRKIRQADALSSQEQNEAIDLATSLPRGAALLHGDLHPGNVLMGPSGPVVIDWFDATIGHPVADIVRSSILMQPRPNEAPRHLPMATTELLGEVHQAYLREFKEELAFAEQELSEWVAVSAAARLAEGAEVDEGELFALWAARTSGELASSLLVAPD